MCLAVNDKSVILDGEICVWDKVNNRCAPFGENKPTANSEEFEKQLICAKHDHNANNTCKVP